MKPTKTSHVLRSILKELGSAIRVDHLGFPMHDLQFPAMHNAKQFAKDYLAYNIARKRESKDASHDAIAASLAKLGDSEWRCSVINRCGTFYSPLCSERREVLSTLRKRTAYHLNALLCDVWPDLTAIEFTSGASVEFSRAYNHSALKHGGTPPTWAGNRTSVTCNKALQDLFQYLLEENPGYARRLHKARWGLLLDDLVDIDIDIAELAEYICSADGTALLDYVPKDVDSVRLIAKTTSGTMCIQKMFGNAIRSALMKVGINLNDQTINNQWAEIGSLTGLVATVDLSSASDSISMYNLRLFPKRWAEWLRASRDTHIRVNSSFRHRLQMVAGMGNGYIFEMQSALFWAMATSTCEYLGLDTSYVSVYGDDIILPSRGVDLLNELLTWSGFVLNKDKSFWDGPFRESCGKHYYNGVDVSPVYVKGDLDTSQDIVHLINGLHDWSLRTGVGLPQSIALLMSYLPLADRVVVPRNRGSRAGVWEQVVGYDAGTSFFHKGYQRSVVTFRELTLKTKDQSERYGPTARLCLWFMSEPEEEVITIPPSRIRACAHLVKAFRKPFRFSTPTKFIEDLDTVTQRSVRIVRDA